MSSLTAACAALVPGTRGPLAAPPAGRQPLLRRLRELSPGREHDMRARRRSGSTRRWPPTCHRRSSMCSRTSWASAHASTPIETSGDKVGDAESGCATRDRGRSDRASDTRSAASHVSSCVSRWPRRSSSWRSSYIRLSIYSPKQRYRVCFAYRQHPHRDKYSYSCPLKVSLSLSLTTGRMATLPLWPSKNPSSHGIHFDDGEFPL